MKEENDLIYPNQNQFEFEIWMDWLVKRVPTPVNTEHQTVLQICFQVWTQALVKKKKRKSEHKPHPKHKSTIIQYFHLKKPWAERIAVKAQLKQNEHIHKQK
jgi:16S rRNA A1518/A1519 N6-dimethyltransferase RsmA/KsgA/DIM1 with predicted DNA glycosylase/AP lyase activity